MILSSDHSNIKVPDYWYTECNRLVGDPPPQDQTLQENSFEEKWDMPTIRVPLDFEKNAKTKVASYDQKYFQSVYNSLRQSFPKVLYRCGEVPSKGGWEFGGGGTFFSCDIPSARQYGDVVDAYRVKQVPRFLVDLYIDEDQEIPLGPKGVITDIQDSRYMTNFLGEDAKLHADAILVHCLLNGTSCSPLDNVWILNKNLSSFVEPIDLSK